MATTLREDLNAMDGSPFTGPEVRLEILAKNGSRAWLSGMPYDLSGYIERAYVFGSVEDAVRIASKHFPERFYRVHVAAAETGETT